MTLVVTIIGVTPADGQSNPMGDSQQQWLQENNAWM